MIDLTAGFQMTANGRRNIFLRGAMLGRSKKEIAETYDEIVMFAELGDAIEAPVSTFSSGMLMRLAFSIMVAMKPDVLFLDEVLSVGDFYFRQKCLTRIRELRESAAFVFVSHSMSSIKQFCDRVIVLERGCVAFIGPPDEAIDYYETSQTSMPSGVNNTKEKRRSDIVGPQLSNEKEVELFDHYWSDKDGNPITEIKSHDDLYFRARFTLHRSPKNLILGIPVWTENGEYVTGFSIEFNDTKNNIVVGEESVWIFEAPAIAFNPGNYISVFGVMDGLEFLYRGENSPLTVNKRGQNRCFGMVTLPHHWQLIAENKENC